VSGAFLVDIIKSLKHINCTFILSACHRNAITQPRSGEKAKAPPHENTTWQQQNEALIMPQVREESE